MKDQLNVTAKLVELVVPYVANSKAVVRVGMSQQACAHNIRVNVKGHFSYFLAYLLACMDIDSLGKLAKKKMIPNFLFVQPSDERLV